MLSSLLAPDSISLDLAGTSRDEVLTELGALLPLSPNDRTAVQKLLKRREGLGSTGVGRGIAIPHARTSLIDDLRLAYGRHERGVSYGAIDALPVHHFLLIIAPPIEFSNEYLPVLGRVAQFAKEEDVPARLSAMASKEDLLQLLREKGL